MGDSWEQKYIPLFPYFYCKDVQHGHPGQATSDSESQEEVKGSGSNNSAAEQNSLSGLKLEEVAPASDVSPYFFGDNKNKADGANRYDKL